MMAENVRLFPMTRNGPATSPLEFWQYISLWLKGKENQQVRLIYHSRCVCAHRDAPAIFRPQRMTTGDTVTVEIGEMVRVGAPDER